MMKAPIGLLIRPPDKWGDGTFGASRDGVARAHMGLDLAVWPGMPVYPPAECKVIREAPPYADDARFGGLLLRLVDDADGVVEIKMFYLSPVPGIVGRHVTSADVIGYAQDLRSKYAGITPHVHIEVTKQGVRIDPRPLLEDRIA